MGDRAGERRGREDHVLPTRVRRFLVSDYGDLGLWRVLPWLLIRKRPGRWGIEQHILSFTRRRTMEAWSGIQKRAPRWHGNRTHLATQRPLPRQQCESLRQDRIHLCETLRRRFCQDCNQGLHIRQEWQRHSGGGI